MSYIAHDAFMQRLDLLERENRLWRRVAALTSVALLFVLLAGQASSKARVVEAERFVARDAQGRVAAEFGLDGGLPVLRLYGREGTVRTAVGLPGFFVNDEDGKMRVSLTDLLGLILQHNDRLLVRLKGSNDSAELKLFDVAGNVRARMATSRDGTPTVELADVTGKVIWRAP